MWVNNTSQEIIPRRDADKPGVGGDGARWLECSCIEEGNLTRLVMGVKRKERLSVWKKSSFRVWNFPWVALENTMATHSSILAWRIP